MLEFTSKAKWNFFTGWFLITDSSFWTAILLFRLLISFCVSFITCIFQEICSFCLRFLWCYSQHILISLMSIRYVVMSTKLFPFSSVLGVYQFYWLFKRPTLGFVDCSVLSLVSVSLIYGFIFTICFFTLMYY